MITKREFLLAAVLTITSLCAALATVGNELSVIPAKPSITISISVPPREVVDNLTNVNIKVSLEDAIKAVKNVWPSLPVNATVAAELIRDHIEGIIYWEVSWKSGMEYLLIAQVDAGRGIVFSIFDFKSVHTSRVDNIKSCSKAIKIAEDIIERLEIDLSQLSNPDCWLDVLQIADGPIVAYRVNWSQVYRGLKVRDGFVVVKISAESGEPAAFHIKLIDVSEVDTSPVIQRDEAVRIARTFVEQRGYRVSGVSSVELCIVRPNYYWSGSLAQLGKPTLVWLVVLSDPCGYPIEVQVDAKTGEVVGGQLCRCKCM